MTNITEIHAISAVLRAIRANLDLTQEQLAEQLERTQRELRNGESDG